MTDLRRSRWWDRLLEGGLPDCRLTLDRRRTAEVIVSPTLGAQLMERVYCANCGKLDGYVTADWSPHVFCVCNECVGQNGPPPGCVEVPDAVVRGYGPPSDAADWTFDAKAGN